MYSVSGPHKSLSNPKTYVSQSELIPAFYDGQDRTTTPVFYDTRVNIKQRRKQGLIAWYQENAKVLILYRPRAVERDPMTLAAGGGFDSAWAIQQSGYAGPLVWQLA